MTPLEKVREGLLERSFKQYQTLFTVEGWLMIASLLPSSPPPPLCIQAQPRVSEHPILDLVPSPLAVLEALILWPGTLQSGWTPPTRSPYFAFFMAHVILLTY